VTGRALFNNANVQIFNARGATHRQVCMRVDAKNPLKNFKVRQAIAPLLAEGDRQRRSSTTSPTWATTRLRAVVSVDGQERSQRHKDIPAAKKLMAQAGHPKGFSSR